MSRPVAALVLTFQMLCAGLAWADELGDPRIEGSLTLTLERGMLAGNLCVSNLTEAEEYEFLLNRGLNIRAVRSHRDGDMLAFHGFFNATSEGDATRYRVPGPFPEHGLCVEYVGAYPVYKVDAGERAAIDWKGQIAFDGRTVRAAEQSRFYPVLIDPVSGAPLERVSFDIRVACPKCSTIYIGGDAPAVGQTRARLRSDNPRALLLYAGEFPVYSSADAHFLGAEVDPESSAAVTREIGGIARTLEDLLGIEYDEKPALLSFASVSRDHQLGEVDWAFLTWPTIALSGRRPFAALMEMQDGQLQLTADKRMLLSHEMAHYYFGGRYMPRGPLLNFLMESTAEFLALKAVRELEGESAYEARLVEHFKIIASDTVVPLNQVTRPPQLSGNFPYRIGPLLLVVLGEHVGEKALLQALSTLVLDSPRDPLDYADFRARVLAADGDQRGLERFEEACLVASIAASCLRGRFDRGE